MARKSKYENQVKKVCGLDFSSHEYNSKARKLRVTTVIKDIIYEYWMNTQTWKNAKESKGSTFNPEGKRFQKSFKVIEKVQNYLPMKLEDIPMVNFVGDLTQQGVDMFNEEFNNAITFKEIKAVYRKYVKRLHPDISRGNQHSFKVLVSAYEYCMTRRRMMVDICRKNGIDMEY